MASALLGHYLTSSKAVRNYELSLKPTFAQTPFISSWSSISIHRRVALGIAHSWAACKNTKSFLSVTGLLAPNPTSDIFASSRCPATSPPIPFQALHVHKSIDPTVWSALSLRVHFPHKLPLPTGTWIPVLPHAPYRCLGLDLTPLIVLGRKRLALTASAYFFMVRALFSYILSVLPTPHTVGQGQSSVHSSKRHLHQTQLLKCRNPTSRAQEAHANHKHHNLPRPLELKTSLRRVLQWRLCTTMMRGYWHS